MDFKMNLTKRLARIFLIFGYVPKEEYDKICNELLNKEQELHKEKTNKTVDFNIDYRKLKYETFRYVSQFDERKLIESRLTVQEILNITRNEATQAMAKFFTDKLEVITYHEPSSYKLVHEYRLDFYFKDNDNLWQQ